MMPFDADSFEGLELDVFVDWIGATKVDLVIDLFQNVPIKYMNVFVNNKSVIDPGFYSKLKGDQILVEFCRQKDPTIPIDLCAVPHHININLTIQSNTHEQDADIIGADRAQTIYFLSNSESIMNLIQTSILTYDTLPHLISIGYMPLLPNEFPLEDSTLFKLLDRCNSELIIFLHDTYAKDPTIIPFVSFFAEKVGMDKLIVKYYTHDTHVLATIIHRITGIKIIKLISDDNYEPTLELTRALGRDSLSDLKDLFQNVHTRAMWWHL
jgi:hypothetical protein